MTVKDFVDMVMNHLAQESLERPWVYGKKPDRKELAQRFLKAYQLEEKTLSMSDDRIRIDWASKEDKLITAFDLAKTVKDGYWVYSSLVSTEDMLFKRFDDKREAFKDYLNEMKAVRAETKEEFLSSTCSVDALFIDTYRKRCIPNVSDFL